MIMPIIFLDTTELVVALYINTALKHKPLQHLNKIIDSCAEGTCAEITTSNAGVKFSSRPVANGAQKWLRTT